MDCWCCLKALNKTLLFSCNTYSFQESTSSVGIISAKQYALLIYPVRWSLKGSIKTEKGFLEVPEFIQFPQPQTADMKISLHKTIYIQKLYPLSLIQTSEKAQCYSWSDIPCLWSDILGDTTWGLRALPYGNGCARLEHHGWNVNVLSEATSFVETQAESPCAA